MLFAIAAIALPVLIHLWNVRKGKTIKVGSIALLSASARQRSRSLRIDNWPLLLLRCLLLALLALLLAQPFWHKQQKAANAGWILVPTHQLKMAHAQYGPQIDSLLAAGLELHNLSAGFEPLQLADTASGQTPHSNDPKIVSPWSLLTVLDAQLPASFPVHVFINNRLSQFKGNRPLTHLAIHWNSFQQADSLQQSIINTYATADGKVMDLSLMSTPEGNYYQEHNKGAVAAAADSAALQIAIYAGNNSTDARYVKAAIDAIAQYSNRKIATTLLSVGNSPAPVNQQLIFWLDDKAPATDLLTSLTPNGILFQYDTGTVVKTNSWLNDQHQPFQANVTSKLYRYAAGQDEGQPLYTLANGQPLLTTEEKDGKHILHFKSRFNPQWNDMVWEETFVKFLLPWVMPEQPAAVSVDIRQVDDQQVIPQQAIAAGGSKNNHTNSQNNKDLSFIIWIVAFIVFAIERVLSRPLGRGTKQPKPHA
jgi:hypothetical protein